MESLTTIVTILTPIWLVMKLFMGEDVDLLLKWFEVSKAGLIGPELVHRAIEKAKVIQERLKTVQSHQESYIDVRRKTLEFEVKDWVCLKVQP